MSDKDKIREMVMALARGDQDAARSAASEAISAKTKRLSESVDSVDSEEEVEEGMHNPARRHMRAGARDYNRKKTMTRDMHNREATYEGGYAEGDVYEGGVYAGKQRCAMRDMDLAGEYESYTEARRPADMDDEEYAMHARKRDRKVDPSMRRRRPRPSQMHEADDTKTGESDSVKDKADHEKHDGDKPDAIKDKGKSAGKDGKDHSDEGK